MKIRLAIFVLSILSGISSFGQNKPVTFTSSDTALQTAFNRAKMMALSYKGKPGDPVGQWYESALPPRSAFCMRDVSHQSIAAEILGLSKENKNMMDHFVSNISKSKDWCSYWEVNKYGKPANEDYRNDTAFWYNLNGNFDVLSACWKLYLWTGDKAYINAPEYANFHQKSTREFIDTWILQADSLLSRPSHPREPKDYDRKDSFHEYRGLPSYSEGVPHVKMGVDMIASIYRGLISYSAMLRLNNKPKEAEHYEQKAATYQQRIESDWWDKHASLYNTHYTEENTFGKGEGETFLLWFDALEDSIRARKTIEHLLSKDWNIENQSYFPYQFYRHGYSKEAYKYVLHLTDPATKRREYPEVSFGVIQAIVQGLMGIQADASTRTVISQFQGDKEITVELDNVPVLSGLVNVKHEGSKRSTITNVAREPINWKAEFPGKYENLLADGKLIKAVHEKNWEGKTFSFVKVKAGAGQQIIVSTEK